MTGKKSAVLLVSILILLLALPVYTSLPSSCQGRACIQRREGPEPSGVTVFRAPAAPLTEVYHDVITGDYVAAGTSLRNEPWDLITITGIPGGAEVVAAYLIWAIQNDTSVPSTIRVNGTLFNGVLAGTDLDYCWGQAYSYVFYADVTSVVTGNGVYNISGYPTGDADFSDPWVSSTPPLAEGASLVVIYEYYAAPPREIVLLVGDLSTESFGGAGATLSALINITNPPYEPVQAKNTWIVADGQNNALYDQTLFGGVGVAGPGSTLRPDDAFPGADPRTGASSYGSLWDTLTVDVSWLVSPGDTSFNASIHNDPVEWDCLGYVGNVFSVKVGPGVVGGELTGPEEGGSTFDTAALAAAAVTAVAAAYLVARKRM